MLNSQSTGEDDLPVFEAGQPLIDQLTATRLNAICRAIRRHKTIWSSDFHVFDSEDGQAVAVKFPIEGDTGTTAKPFQISAVKNMVDGDWDGTYNVSLYPGTLNSNVPGNILDTINQTISSTQYVILTGASDGYAVTSSTWSLTGSPPSPVAATADTPPSSFTQVLGIIFYDADEDSITIFQIVSTDLTATPTEWTRTSRTGAGPFELAYVIYYWWKIQ